MHALVYHPLMATALEYGVYTVVLRGGTKGKGSSCSLNSYTQSGFESEDV